MIAIVGAGLAAPYLIQRLRDVGNFVSLRTPVVEWVCFSSVFGVFALQLARRKHTLSALALVALLAVPMLGLVGSGLGIAANLKSSRVIGGVVANLAHPADLVAMQAPDDSEYENVAGLAFYVGRRVRLVRRADTLPLFWPPPPDQDFFLDESEIARGRHRGGCSLSAMPVSSTRLNSFQSVG